jgi:hypothetical protein
MDTAELKQIINKIRDKSKDEAKVDTGFLKRSIYGIINEKGVAEFGEIFYGQFYENSNLEENINKMFPKNLPYKLVYFDEDGVEYVAKRRTTGGRTIKPENPKKGTNIASSNIRKFIKGLTDGKETDARTKDGESNNKEKPQ